ncbi:unnamed protein product [Rotaria magnacalcarata]|uniref:Choline transporter-like protein n=1 Tax=Rotaria magnacalcarata TaxID=392030 RepID=A0A816R6K6_9BILA|nr:unnamed protein product [Rotaria magnacalcarata]
MILLRYFARWIIWLSLILCNIVFALAANFCFVARIRMQKYFNDSTDKDNNTNLLNTNEMNITYDINELDTNDIKLITRTISINKTQFSLENFDTAMILLDQFAPVSIIWLLGILCCVMCVILLTCTCCLYERIVLAAALIEEACKAISYALTILILPMITFFLNICCVILGILGRAIYQISCSQDFGQSCRNASNRTYVKSNESIELSIRSMPQSCFDFNEGDNCNPDDFSQLNCATDRIRCVYASYGFGDETFTGYFNTTWSHRLAQFLRRYSWFINIFNIFMIY